MPTAWMQASSPVVNALASPAQLATSRSQIDGLSLQLERSMLFASARQAQAAGILLRLPQDLIAQAIVLFTRFWVGAEGGSLKEYDAHDVSAAALYLVSKASATPRSPRAIINVYAYLAASARTFTSKTDFFEAGTSAADSWHVSPGTFETRRARLLETETRLLRTLGFQTRVALPHNLCIHYLQALDVLGPDSDGVGRTLAKRAFAHLNTVLLSPQFVYLTHQPGALATAAIYLAAKEVRVTLPGGQWWEVFDTDREELGFLVVAMISMDGFVRAEAETWMGRKVPSRA